MRWLKPGTILFFGLECLHLLYSSCNPPSRNLLFNFQFWNPNNSIIILKNIMFAGQLWIKWLESVIPCTFGNFLGYNWNIYSGEPVNCSFRGPPCVVLFYKVRRREHGRLLDEWNTNIFAYSLKGIYWKFITTAKQSVWFNLFIFYAKKCRIWLWNPFLQFGDVYK